MTQKNDFTEWYIQTIQKAELMAYSPVKGSIIFRPDGFELWEHIQEEFNRFLKKEGIRNAYFPMLIPQNFFMKEADHIEGFAPELPWVTEVGNEKLEEPLALRPTSETMIGSAFLIGSTPTVTCLMKSINGQTSFVGKRKHCLSCVPQSFYGKKVIPLMKMKKMLVNAP